MADYKLVVTSPPPKRHRQEINLSYPSDEAAVEQMRWLTKDTREGSSVVLLRMDKPITVVQSFTVRRSN